MTEQTLIVFSSANLIFAVDFIAWCEEWCEENGFSEAKIRNTGDLYEVLATPAVARCEEIE